MASRVKLLLAVLAGTIVLAGVLVALPAWLVLRDGFLEVSVHEAAPGGSTVEIRVPGSLVRLACAFAPRMPPDARGPDAEAVRGIATALAAAARNFEDVPEAVLYEIEEGGDRVVVAKRGGVLSIEVDDASGDRVRIVIPPRVLTVVSETLADRLYLDPAPATI